VVGELFDSTAQPQLVLGSQQILDQPHAGSESDSAALPNQILSECRQQMRLAAAGLLKARTFFRRSRKPPSNKALSCRAAFAGRRFVSKLSIVFSNGRREARSSFVIRCSKRS